MRKRRIGALLLLTIMLLSNSGFSAQADPWEILLDAWCSRIIDLAPSPFQEPHEASVPSKHLISQRDALSAAAEMLVQLGLETPESLLEYDGVGLDFYFQKEYGMHVWDIILHRGQNPIYTIRVNADTGRLHALYQFDSSKLPELLVRENSSIDALIDHWDALYAESPNYSPEVYGGEMQNAPLPGQNDMPQRTALRCAVGMALALSNHDAAVFGSYRPYVSFDVSPFASRWIIQLIEESGASGSYEVFALTLNASSGSLERFAWYPLAR